MGLRALLDKLEPKFRKGTPLHALYPVYEAIDTALYSPGHITEGPSHVRDGIDLKRVMITVWMVAWIPAIVGMFLIGLNANEAMQASGLSAVDGWRGFFLNALITYNPASGWDNFVHGLFYFMPAYIVTFTAGIAVEALFASKRGHEINEGFFVTSILYTLTLPATTPAMDGCAGHYFWRFNWQGSLRRHRQEFFEPGLGGARLPLFCLSGQHVRRGCLGAC